MAVRLQKLSLNDKNNRTVYYLLQAIPAKENGFTNNANGLTWKEFHEWVVDQEKTSRGIDVPPDRVPQTYFWLYDDVKCIGLGKIRHQLNDRLRNHGGHIGYAIHPKLRGQGHGTTLLKLLLIEAAKIGITQALITCSVNNIPSQKIITKNGGVLNSKTDTTRRYLIKIS